MSPTDPASLGREHWPGRLAQGRQMLEAQLRRQDWAGAQRLVDSALQRYPGTAFAPFLAGIFELARGASKQAEGRLRESLTASPRSPVIAAALSGNLVSSEGAEFAGDQLQRLADRDPGFVYARYLAARAYVDNRDPQRAEPRSGASRRQLGSPTFVSPDEPAARARPQSRRGHRVPAGTGAVPAESCVADDPSAWLEAEPGRTVEASPTLRRSALRRPDLDLAEYKLAALLASQPKGPIRLAVAQILRDLGGSTLRPDAARCTRALHASVGETDASA
jgi:hypothetical protein